MKSVFRLYLQLCRMTGVVLHAGGCKDRGEAESTGTLQHNALSTGVSLPMTTVFFPGNDLQFDTPSQR